MNWSYTALTCWETCAAQYNFRYNQRLKGEQTQAVQRGSNHHGMIETYLTVKETPIAPEIKRDEVLLDRLRELPDLKVETKIGLDEKWRPVEWGEAWFRCVLDAWEPGTIWEWKTGRKYESHKDQRRLYGMAGLALEEAPAITVNGYYLDDRSTETDIVTLKDAIDIKDDFGFRVEIMQNDKIFAPRPGWYCRFCSYAKSKGGPCRFS